MESNQKSSQEIDLSFIAKKTGSIVDYFGYLAFRIFKFILKNIFVFIGILVIGAVIGYFLDQRKEDIYKHEIVVVPNFGSNTYLYNSINNLKTQGTNITQVEIEPILDIYQFIRDRYQNLEIAKYLSQNNIQLNKFQPNSDVEKLYRYHLLTFYTIGEQKPNGEIDSILNKLNSEPYFLQRQKVENENLKIVKDELSNTVESINSILDKIGSSSGSTGELNIEMYSEINNLINSKKGTLDELGKISVEELEQSKVIYDSSRNLNIKQSSISKMVLIPVLLLGVYVIFYVLYKKVYKRYQNRLNDSAH